jgi:hypothetical protein
VILPGHCVILWVRDEAHVSLQLSLHRLNCVLMIECTSRLRLRLDHVFLFPIWKTLPRLFCSLGDVPSSSYLVREGARLTGFLCSDHWRELMWDGCAEGKI